MFLRVFVKTLFCVKESASDKLKHKGEFIGTLLEQLRNPGAAFGTRTGELLSLVSLCLSPHLLHFSPLSFCVHLADKSLLGTVRFLSLYLLCSRDHPRLAGLFLFQIFGKGIY